MQPKCSLLAILQLQLGKALLWKLFKARPLWWTNRSANEGNQGWCKSIIPFEFVGRKYDLIILYDFATQREFYASHAVQQVLAVLPRDKLYLSGWQTSCYCRQPCRYPAIKRWWSQGETQFCEYTAWRISDLNKLTLLVLLQWTATCSQYSQSAGMTDLCSYFTDQTHTWQLLQHILATASMELFMMNHIAIDGWISTWMNTSIVRRLSPAQ